MSEKVSIIIVNCNGKKWLEGCLDSLSKQTYKNTEIIFVDNGSNDGSIELVRKKYSKVKLILSKDNVGFAGGNNLGYKVATGSLILLLNNDTTVEKDYIKNFVKGFVEIPKAGILQSKIVLMQKPNIIDTCGSFFTSTTFLYHYGNMKDAFLPKYNKPFRVFSVKGAAILLKRELIEKLGFFDDDFWCYYEETDLCHRAWLSGYESWYWPHATALHGGGGTSLRFPNDFVQFHNFKNKLLSYLKNFETHNLLTIIPTFVILNVVLSLVWVLQGKPKHAGSLYRAIWWNIVHGNETLHKRKSIQKLRKVPDYRYFQKVKKNPRLEYYYHLFSLSFEKYQD